MKVGLMLPIGEQEKVRRSLPWSELREMTIAAEAGGLDSVWAADHLIFRENGTSIGIHSISGGVEEVGQALAAYRELGIEHTIVHLWPPTTAAVTELGRAAEVARADARIGTHG